MTEMTIHPPQVLMNNITKTEMISEINIIDRDMGQVCSKSEID